MLAGALNFTQARRRLGRPARRGVHLSLLGAAFFLLLAVNAYLQVPHLLTDVEHAGIVPRRVLRRRHGAHPGRCAC